MSLHGGNSGSDKMKGQYADRKCKNCEAIIPAKDEYCPKCDTRQGRENKDTVFPGPYKGWVKK